MMSALLISRRQSQLFALTLLSAVLCLCLTESSLAEEPSVETHYLRDVRQITSGMVKAGEGYFSPDGKQIIYQAIPQEYPFYQIFTQNLAGGKPKIVSTGRGRTTCSYFAPDGKSVIFASSHLDPKIDKTEADARAQQAEDRRTGRRRRYSWVFDPSMEIFRTDLNGKNAVQLTNTPGYDAECAYSPDGKQIVFTSDRDGDPDLYIMDADGSNVRQLTNEKGYDGGPFFSPDGQWVVFRSDREEKEHLQIRAIRVDGTQDTQITKNLNWVNWAPYWHPTEPYIIWCGADHSIPGKRPNYDLWMVRYEIKDGKLTIGKKLRITDSPSADVLPVFSPDGKYLMWTSTRTADRSSQLWLGRLTIPEP